MLFEFLNDHPIGALALLALLTWYLFNRFNSDRKTPPGPWGVPLFGYLPFLGRKMNVGLVDLGRKYGDVFQLSIGTRNIVVLNGNEVLKEALAQGNDSFSGRPDFFTYRLADTAFGFADWGPRFRTLKKIGVKSLGMFSNSRNESLEEVAQRAAQDFIQVCKDKKNEPFNPKDDLYQIVCGIMGFICYGKQFTKDDEELKRILGSADEVGKTVVAGVLVDYIPSLKFLMKGQIERYKNVMGKIRGYSASLVKQCLKNYPGPEGKLMTVADAMQRSAEEMSQDEKDTLNITNEYITGMVSNLFGAGFGTISITIRWSFMLMANAPEVQDRLFKEIDEVVGKDREVKFDDVRELPYLNACITEIYRYSSIASVALTHKATKDLTFRGYFIPEGTPVIPNIFSAHHDERVFPQPEIFKPERFIKESGEFDRKLSENVFPYGLGHRRCGGEALARLEIYLFLATIFHRCKVFETPGEPMDPVTDYNFTFGLDPKPFRVILKSRYGEW